MTALVIVGFFEDGVSDDVGLKFKKKYEKKIVEGYRWNSVKTSNISFLLRQIRVRVFIARVENRREGKRARKRESRGGNGSSKAKVDVRGGRSTQGRSK